MRIASLQPVAPDVDMKARVTMVLEETGMSEMRAAKLDIDDFLKYGPPYPRHTHPHPTDFVPSDLRVHAGFWQRSTTPTSTLPSIPACGAPACGHPACGAPHASPPAAPPHVAACGAL